MARIILMLVIGLVCTSAYTATAEESQMSEPPIVVVGDIEIGGVVETNAASTKEMLRYIIWGTLRGQGLDVDLGRSFVQGGSESPYSIDVKFYDLGDGFLADLRLIELSSGAVIDTEYGQGEAAEVVGKLESMAVILAGSIIDSSGGDISVAFGSFDYSGRLRIPILQSSQTGRIVRDDICGGDVSVAIHRYAAEIAIPDVSVLDTNRNEIDCGAGISPLQIAEQRDADIVISGNVLEAKGGVTTDVFISSGENIGTLKMTSLLSDPNEYETYRNGIALRVTGYLTGIAEAWEDRSEIFGAFEVAAASELIENAKYYQDKGNNHLAVLYFQRATALAPENAEALNSLANLYFDLSDIYSADDMYRQAIRAVQLEPTNFWYRWDLANALTLLSRFDEALAEITTLELMAGSDADRGLLAHNRGQLYTLTGNYDDAVIAYELATLFDPARVDSALSAADLYMIDYNYEEAIRVLEKTRNNHPDDFSISAKLSDIYNQSGSDSMSSLDYSAARTFYNKALEIEPNNVTALRQLSYIAFEIDNDFELAYDSIAEAMRIELSNSGFVSVDVLSGASEPALAVGNIDEALAIAAEVLPQTNDSVIETGIHFSRLVAAVLRREYEQADSVLVDLAKSAEFIERNADPYSYNWSYSGIKVFIDGSTVNSRNKDFLLNVTGYLEGEIELSELHVKISDWVEVR